MGNPLQMEGGLKDVPYNNSGNHDQKSGFQNDNR